MDQETLLISLGELLEETGETENDNEILERLKLLAKERMPEGWMSWKVTRHCKEDIFGDCVDPQILTKLNFALPNDLLTRVFVPESTHLSEKGFRDLKLKMLDWAFARALIISPPAICNKIRGSAAATELFNEAVGVGAEKIISTEKVDRALGMKIDGETTGTGRWYDKGDMSSDSESDESYDSSSKRSRIDILEQRMVGMFSSIKEKIELFRAQSKRGETQDSSCEEYSSEEDYPLAPSRSGSSESWHAPSMGFTDANDAQSELDYLPEVEDANSNVPELSEHIIAEGIASQRFGSEAWNRVSYQAVEERLNTSLVFSALKTNAELRGQGGQMARILAKHDGIFGTIIHGLLCQRKALTEALKKLEVKYPSAAENLRKVLSEGSDFKAKSDALLQYVYDQRAEIIQMRRRLFKASNDILTSMLQQIPPSQTHLFHEEKLSMFIRENGGVSQVFPPRFRKAFVKKRRLLMHSGQNRHTGTRMAKSKVAQNPVVRPRQTRTANQIRIQPGRTVKKTPNIFEQRKRRR